MKVRVCLVISLFCWLSLDGPSARADVVLAGVQDGPFNGVATFSPTLGFINQVATDGPVLGLTTGASNDFYVSVGNRTLRYSDSGALLNTIAGSPTTVTPALSFANGTVFAGVQDGSFNGVAMFTSTLGFISQVATDGPILGLAAGGSNDFYVSVGNHTNRYSLSGTLLNSISGSPTTATPALSFGNGTVFAAVQDGSFSGVAMFTSTLGFISQVATDGPVLGIVAGANNDFYVSVGNHTNHYSLSGALLGTITGSPTTLTPALSYRTTVVPEPPSLALVLIGAIGLVSWRCLRRVA
ncbi:MAG: PEP-CTERM sorting domain-containing protein [Isosphaeraceae bacterium]